MSASIDLTGQRFGHWAVVRRIPVPAHVTCPKPYWECACDCGTTAAVSGDNLRSGVSQSCGCQAGNQWTSRSPEKPVIRVEQNPTHRSWTAMKKRCLDRNAADYHRYGGRGIKVCDRWKHSFENFLADMGERPEGRTLDRIDNEGDYAPANCRWSTNVEQGRNKRNSHRLAWAGETLTIAGWAEKTGLPASLIGGRLRRGWSAEDALTRPVRRIDPRRAERSHCAHGHPFDAANTRMWQGNRKCRQCDRDFATKKRAATRPEHREAVA
jgi:hypothetical protein